MVKVLFSTIYIGWPTAALCLCWYLLNTLQRYEKYFNYASFSINIFVFSVDYFSSSAMCRFLHQEMPFRGARCAICFEQRLRKAAETAKAGGYDWFCTTLTVSPHKNAQVLNHIGQKLAQDVGVPFLPSDFKKRDGYKKSIELSREYCLYRQNYCGCEFSSRPEESDAETQVMSAVVSKSIAEGTGQGKAGFHEI